MVGISKKEGHFLKRLVIFMSFILLMAGIVYSQELTITINPETVEQGGTIIINIMPVTSFYNTSYVYKLNGTYMASISIDCTEHCSENKSVSFVIPSDWDAGYYHIEVFDYSQGKYVKGGFAVVEGAPPTGCGNGICEEGEINCTQDCGDGVFEIFTSTINGGEMKLVLSDSYRQMTHTRASPDNEWITFSRYNDVGIDGCATEDKNNYPDRPPRIETEVMVIPVDGGTPINLVGPKEGQANTNSYWNSDRDLLHMFVPNYTLLDFNLNRITLDDGMQVINTETLPLPDYLLPVDPQQRDDKIVFTAVDTRDWSNGVWIMNSDYLNLRKLTETNGFENDPKISPDGSKVAFMRLTFEHYWHVYIYDLTTDELTDISEGNIDNICQADAMPEWSADGTRFVIWHIDFCDLENITSEIWTLDADGSNRQKVELPSGFFYHQPSFYPESNDKIVFGSRKEDMACYGAPELCGTEICGSDEYCDNGVCKPAVFDIFTANLDGSKMKTLITDSYRDMTHARVSPDKEWIVFSRYNNIGNDGCASCEGSNFNGTWGQHYLETEIMLMRVNGSDLRTIVPAREYGVAVNPYWTPDGKGLLHMYSEGGKVNINHILFDENMEIKSSSFIPLPDDLSAADPYWGKDSTGNDLIVFPGVNKTTNKTGIWMVRPDGSDLEKLTSPEYQDNDPKISPDGTKIAFVRKLGEWGVWVRFHTIILDLETREETDLSEGYFPGTLFVGGDVMPEWSSDGELLIFWHIYWDTLEKVEERYTELHTMKPDGTERTKIPFPEEYGKNMPNIVAFFPGEGSDDNTRIIFSTRKSNVTCESPTELCGTEICNDTSYCDNGVCKQAVFGLYSANFDGSEMKLIHGDSYREMTHARVSPNGEWIAFTRYNDVSNDSCASEKSGYFNAEIVLIKTDGSIVKTIVGPRPNEVATNSYWVTDNTLLYLAWKAGTPIGGIYKLYLNQSMDVINEERLNTPENVRVADPHQVGDKIVFPGMANVSVFNSYNYSFPGTNETMGGIWIMNENGSGAHPIAVLRYSNGTVIYMNGTGGGKPGNNDCKLSPDGTKVAFMRRTISDISQFWDQGVHNWHVYIVNASNPLSEVDISAQHFTGDWANGYFDGLPEWIDNETVLVWHGDSVSKIGSTIQEVHKMKDDGSEREKIPLPEGYYYKMASFFSKENKIIFSAKKLNMPCEGAPISTCSQQNGFICSATEYCPGNNLTASDTDRCCDIACQEPGWTNCDNCGDGLFNLCDRDECHFILEGCYYQGTFICDSCSALSCSDYNDETDCLNDNSICRFGNCSWEGGSCVGAPTCTNDTGCSSEGLFCQGNMPYNCSVGIDTCLDRTNMTDCGSDMCVDGTGCVVVTTTFDGWRVLPIRSEEEYNLGKIGGEAEQHPHSIARSPSNPDIIYLSHDVAGVWKSIDAGETWKKTLGINLSLNFGQSIEVDPVNPNIVFLIVSQAYNWLAEDYAGVYRSKDRGDTWEFILPMNVEVRRTYQHSIAYDPTSATGNQTMTWYATTIEDGLFRSDDGGDSWTGSLGLKKEIKTNVFTQGYEDSKWPARLMFNGIYTDTSVLGLLNFKINYKFNETKNLDHIDLYQGDWKDTYDYAKELLIEFDDGSSMNATLEQLPWQKQTINLTGKQVQNMSITIISLYENPNPSVNWGGFAEVDVINAVGEDVTIWDNGLSTIYDIKSHQTDGKTVYAGTDKGIYCSNNKGQNMNPCGNLPSGAVSSIAINPQNPDMIYVVIRDNGLYRSLDGATTFSLLRSFDATKVFINPGYPDVIYLVGINSNTIISHDAGATWITDMQTVPAPGLDRVGSWKGKIAGGITGIVPNPNDENEAVASSRATLWKTTDGGKYFNDSSTLFTGYAWSWWNDAIAFDPNNAERFATFNCDVGMTLTNNSGNYFDRRNDQAWSWYSGGLISWIGTYSGDFQPISDSQIIVASVGNYWNTQLMYTSDGGKNWELVTQDNEHNLFIAFHPNDPNLVYAGDKISNNSGQNFSKVDFGAYDSYNPSILGMCLSNPDTIYALDSGRTRILRSDDRGVTWYLYSQPGWKFKRLDGLPTFAVDPVDCNKVYTLRNYDLAVFNGSNWRSTGVLALAGGSSLNNFVRAVTVDPNNNSIIYAGMHAAGISHIWRSQDNGYTWEDISYNLPRTGISAIAVNPHTGEVMIGGAFGTWIFPPPYVSKNMIYDSGNAYSMPSCHDGLQNGDEAGVDLGGSCVEPTELCGGEICNETSYCDNGTCKPAVFGLYTANFDGSEMKLLASDSYRELTHVRVSPNGEWVTFTRYNSVGNDSCAAETSGYFNTEVMLMKTNGSEVKTLVGPNVSEIAGNSYWITDNSLLYMGWPEGPDFGGIYKLDLNESMDVINEERLNTPAGIIPADPHQVGDKVVFPGTAFANVYNLYNYSFPEIGSMIRGIWIMNENGSEAHPIAIPRYPNGTVVFLKGVGGGSTGDADPKLSPDGTKVAFMRRTIYYWGEPDTHNWHIYVMNASNPLSEVDISTQHFTGPFASLYQDLVPEWIDNETLLLWHINGINETREVYKMKDDGSEREKINLPQGYEYKTVSFFSKENKIIFSGKKENMSCEGAPEDCGGEICDDVSYCDNGTCKQAVFGLYASTLDGNGMKLLISDTYRQMTHARISPDKEWVAFTRYNNIESDNCSKESGGYFGTEIVLMRTNGSDARTIVPHEQGKISANSYWTPDGKGLIYAFGPNEKNNSQINHIIFDDNMEIKNISKIPIPENVIGPTDPHWRGEWVVFPAADPVNLTRGIWRIKYNGEGLEQLTWPTNSIPMGDNDPKISPDGTKVAFLRQVKKGVFHAVVVDVNTKEETDLSAGYFPEDATVAFDGPPEWSSDGEFLIFPHWFVNESTALFEIHMIRPDGSGRKKVPLPQEYVYHHTAFFPNEGSDDNASVIFSATKMGMPCVEAPAPICTNDTGCSSAGSFCDTNTPYTCSLGRDGCLDRINESDCDDGLYCNGAEICVGGVCQVGIPPTVDDGVGCTVDSCDEVADQILNIPNDASCDNGLYCDGQETCDAILGCQKGIAPSIDDNVGCTIDNCDEVNDTITHTADDSLCLDGLWCNGQETCDALLDCQPGVAPNCDDEIACTFDSCKEGIDLTDDIGNCEYNTTPCPCTLDSNCDDSNPCTDDTCTAQLICQNTPNDANLCDDGFYCTINDGCSAGSCIADSRPVDDSVSCTIDSCDEINDVILHIPNDNLCDNGLYCDGQETCDVILGCQKGIAPSIDDNIGCTIDNCDEVNDTITHTADDSLCLDGLWCNGQETCDALLDCQPGVAPNCDDEIACTFDSCKEGIDLTDDIGACDYDTTPCACAIDADCDDSNPCTDDTCTAQLICQNTPNDTNSCDDSFWCTINDGCSAGSCIADSRPVDDSVSCTIDSCDEINDVILHIPNDASCDNGLYCDGQETCDASLDCQLGTAPNCADSISCTIDSCDESTDSCNYTANDADCDDGLFCNGAEYCDAKLDCQAGVAPNKDDNVGCTIDNCDEVNDIITHTADDSLCLDGLFCNGAEYCDAKLDCQAGVAPICDDGTECTIDYCDALLDKCVFKDNCIDKCNLTNAYWSTKASIEGELVNLTVEGTNCENKEVNFSIYEDDIVLDDYIISFASIFGENKSIAWWQTEYPKDVITDPEYYFIAALTENSSVNKQSGLITVQMGCIENWQEDYGECSINDKQLKYYIDVNNCGTTNNLPADNGTYVNCDYCSEDIKGPFSSQTGCINGTVYRTVYYLDLNYLSCCLVTSLGSDCHILDKEYQNKTEKVMCDGDDDGDGINNSIDKCPYTKADIVNIYGCPLPIADKFSPGLTINFTEVDLLDLDNLSLGIINKGKIKFMEKTTIIDVEDNYSQINLDDNIDIGQNLISLNSLNLPMLNKKARLTLYNLNFTNPKILKESTLCSEGCPIESYIDGTLVFTVEGFTNYSAAETICGDKDCDATEDCSGCSIDCGSCPPPKVSDTGKGGGGGGGGGGAAPKKVTADMLEEKCKYKWDCAPWSSCIDGLQTRRCVNIGTCPDDDKAPLTTKGCEVEEKIITPEVPSSLFYVDSIIKEDDKMDITFTIENKEEQAMEGLEVELNMNYGKSTKILDYVGAFDVQDKHNITITYDISALKNREYTINVKLYRKGIKVKEFNEVVNLK